MNKILGILLFVIIVVGSATVAFAYDPGVTDDDDTFLAAGEFEDKQALYDDVKGKEELYKSIDIKDYEDNSAYFDALRSAWANYTDALELYDGTNATDLQVKLNNSITDYLDSVDLIEDLYKTYQDQKPIYDPSSDDFIKYSDFEGLYNTWESYLDTLFSYNNDITPSTWLEKLNQTIFGYIIEFNKTRECYVNLYDAKDTYDRAIVSIDKLFVFDGNKIKLDVDALSDLSSKWNAYLGALKTYLEVFDNKYLETFGIEDLEEYISSLNTYFTTNLIGSYNIKIGLYNDVIDAKLAFESSLTEIPVKYDKNEYIVLDEDNTKNIMAYLTSAWETYLEVWSLYDSDDSILDGELDRIVEACFDKIGQYNDVIDAKLAFEALLVELSQSVYHDTKGYIVLDEDDIEEIMTQLTSAWDDYLGAWLLYDSDDSILDGEFDRIVGAYFDKIDKYNDAIDAKFAYEAVLASFNVATDLPDNWFTLDDSDLKAALSNFLSVDWDEFVSELLSLGFSANVVLDYTFEDILDSFVDQISAYKVVLSAKNLYEEKLFYIEDLINNKGTVFTDKANFTELIKLWDDYLGALMVYYGLTEDDETIQTWNKTFDGRITGYITGVGLEGSDFDKIESAYNAYYEYLVGFVFDHISQRPEIDEDWEGFVELKRLLSVYTELYEEYTKISIDYLNQNLTDILKQYHLDAVAMKGIIDVTNQNYNLVSINRTYYSPNQENAIVPKGTEKYSANNENVKVYDKDGIVIYLTSNSNYDWFLEVRAKNPGDVLPASIFSFTYIHKNNNVVTKVSCTLDLYGGDVTFALAGVGKCNYVFLADANFEKLPVIKALEDLPINRVYPKFNKFSVDPGFEFVPELGNPEFGFADSTFGPEFGFADSTDGPNTPPFSGDLTGEIIDPKIPTYDIDMPKEIIFTPMGPLEISEPEPEIPIPEIPVLPQGEPEEEPEEDPVVDPNEPAPQNPEVDGEDDPAVVVPEDDAEPDEENKVLAESSMKNTGLPIGLIIALFMSILVVIRIKK